MIYKAFWDQKWKRAGRYIVCRRPLRARLQKIVSKMVEFSRKRFSGVSVLVGASTMGSVERYLKKCVFRHHGNNRVMIQVMMEGGLEKLKHMYVSRHSYMFLGLLPSVEDKSCASSMPRSQYCCSSQICSMGQ